MASGELVEEPLSGALLPSVLENTIGTGSPGSPPKVLVATALRTRRIAMVEVQVYVLGVYMSLPAVPRLRSRSGDEHPGGELDSSGEGASSAGQAGVEELLDSEAEKFMVITLLRSVSWKQFTDGLGDSLCGTAGVLREDLEDLIKDVPPQSFSRGSNVCITVRPVEGEVSVLLGDNPEVTVCRPALCRGLHVVYFGPQAVVRGLPESLARQRALIELTGEKGRTNSFEGDSTESDGGGSASESPRNVASRSWRSEGRGESALAPIPSATELANMSDVRVSGLSSSVASHDTSSRKSTRTRTEGMSWKASAGRESGKDGYRFGDLTRTLIQRSRTKSQDDATDLFFPPDWRGPVEIQEGADWVSAGDMPRITREALATQALSGVLHKHHNSPVRGRLVPRWTERYISLEAGTLKYRRRAGGRVTGCESLEGAWVQVEPQKPGGFVFRVIFPRVDDASNFWRLSCQSQQQATRWVLELAGTCAYYRDLRELASNAAEPDVEPDVAAGAQQPSVVRKSISHLDTSEPVAAKAAQADAGGGPDAKKAAQPSESLGLPQHLQLARPTAQKSPTEALCRMIESCMATAAAVSAELVAQARRLGLLEQASWCRQWLLEFCSVASSHAVSQLTIIQKTQWFRPCADHCAALSSILTKKLEEAGLRPGVLATACRNPRFQNAVCSFLFLMLLAAMRRRRLRRLAVVQPASPVA